MRGLSLSYYFNTAYEPISSSTPWIKAGASMALA